MSAKVKCRDDENEKKEIRVTPERVYVPRNSLLTDLFENKHIQTIYHVFWAITIGLFFNTVIYDYLKHGRLHFGFRLITKGFSNFHWAALLWFSLLLIVCFTYVCYYLWALIRLKLPPKSPFVKYWDIAWLSTLVVFYVYSYIWVLLSPVKFDLAPCSACWVVTEYTRMLMKVHSFVRTNVPKTLIKLPTPKFSKFLYFLFAPTLLYRDEYPRTKHIRWSFVAYHALEIVVGVFFLSFTVERYLVPPFEDFCLKKYLWTDIIVTVFANSCAGMFFMLIMFYIVLHSWQNACAEVLKFADRHFYSDWWTSTTLTRFYRTWNIVVHDWLYIYIYKDLNEIILPKKRTFARIMVFVVSACIHEVMLISILRVFMPILFIHFAGSSIYWYFTRNLKSMASNVILWYCIALGASMEISLYCIEMYAKYNYLMENRTLLDFLKPRSILCDCIE